MEKLIHDFALNTSLEWENLDIEEILIVILDSINLSRSDLSNEIEINNKFGIYAFFIRPNEVYKNCESVNKVWNIKPFKNFPKLIKKRFEQCEAENGWFPFYIGKSEKLGSRIKEHLNHPSQHTTYGLKLKERTEFLKNNQIEVGYWTLPEMEGVPREIRQFIITNLESRLREKMKPWIGKQ